MTVEHRRTDRMTVDRFLALAANVAIILLTILYFGYIVDWWS